MTKKSLYLSAAVIAMTAVFAGAPAPLHAQQAAPVSIGDTDLGGVVRSPNGPEAGVWVIAETNDLPTKMVKIVVTDDQGRYVMPDLPRASYTVWVRGYGLVDSPKVMTVPGPSSCASSRLTAASTVTPSAPRRPAPSRPCWATSSPARMHGCGGSNRGRPARIWSRQSSCLAPSAG